MTLDSREGQSVPDVTFKVRRDGHLIDVTSEALFKGRNVVLFALPGAYTPTCSSNHLPRYNELADRFYTSGIDDIVCLSVNDPFVMEAWGQHQEAENLTLIGDGNGEFTAGMGMLVDKSGQGFGQRSRRYAMLVRNGVIEKLFVEPDLPGDPFEVSDADTMLDYLNPEAGRPSFATLFTKPGCPYCTRAKEQLQRHGIGYEEIGVGQRDVTSRSLRAMTGRASVPQVWIDGEYIGGADDVTRFFAERATA
ncbi:redoxin family protein [Chromohalobacter israelensis]|jgi:glutaredoxin-like protein|uniref:Glutaredoxin-like region n=1 Tax=Chromohalobacter israelensis (strain ATCC BAA-138 / DSM 3043 / CIP 106854 / NCIMB 13768 / 1H11) TaxID=290398 RepID=Q1QY48_CHRI1|nr:redoxin family protein [Chromohalobacter salexigens]ABE58610.1 Glutaredoxin-like region [Chromohalobacter salexigens DSM 3043]MDO0944732.1 redoxin family protein [Chromohalobacter salexigens]NWO54925.1 glutathione peroxidase [Chromohalobacter salexigens]RXE47787.1 glutathione peroxidase [Chromohalobacter salexigens]